jgi:hypothetical protein
MANDFTKSERDAIAHAFNMIEVELDAAPRDYRAGWRDAFKIERKQCSSSDWARALMVENFAQGVRQPKGAAELWTLRPGCRAAHIIGAALLHRAETHHDTMRASIARQRICDELMRLCALAEVAQVAARERRFNASLAALPAVK